MARRCLILSIDSFAVGVERCENLRDLVYAAPACVRCFSFKLTIFDFLRALATEALVAGSRSVGTGRRSGMRGSHGGAAVEQDGVISRVSRRVDDVLHS